MAIGAAQNAPKGSLQLTISATAPNSAPQTAMLTMRVVGSYNFTTPAGTGEVYNSTKMLDNPTIQALASYLNGTVTFSHSTPQLQSLELGDVILLQPKMSSTVPKGFSRTVLNVQESGGQVMVLTKQASLLDMFVTLHIGSPTLITNSTSGLSGTSVQSTSAPQDEKPNTCQGGGIYWLYPKSGLNGGPETWNQSVQMGGLVITAGLTYGICLHGAVSISIHWGGCFSGPETLGNTVCPIPYPGLDYFELTLQGFAGASFDMNGKANSVIAWGPTKIGDDLDSGHIDLCDCGLLWVDWDLYLEGYGTGQVGSHDFDLNAHANFWIIEGPAYQNGGWTWISNLGKDVACNFCSMDLTTVEALGGTSVKFGLGPRADVSIESGMASGNIALHGFLELDVGNIPSNPLWKLSGGLDYTVGFGGFYGVASWSHSDNIFGPIPIFSASPYPPPTPVLIILNTANTIDLTNPGGIHSSGPVNGWGATLGADPQGLPVTCTWMSSEVGMLATTMATGNSLLACPGPSQTDFYGLYNQIVTMGLNQLTVTVIAQDSAGEKSSPSNAVTVKVLLPTPQLQILCAPCSQPTITQNVPFTVQGRAWVNTVVSSAYPNGIIDRCQNVGWAVGGSYVADQVESGEGAWVGAQSGGTGCTTSLTASTPGPTTINLILSATDPQTGEQYVAVDNNGNPIVQSVTVNVQASSTTPPPPPPGATAPTVTITMPTDGPSSPQHTPTSNPVVNLQGTVSGGTPPYTATWTAIYNGQTYTIDTFSSSGIHAIGLAFPNDRWNLASSSYCSQYGYVNGLVSIQLSVTDSNQLTGQTGGTTNPDGSANIDCVQIQTISPVPGAALVSLLTVLFTVTAESKTTLESKPWLRTSRQIFIAQM